MFIKESRLLATKDMLSRDYIQYLLQKLHNYKFLLLLMSYLKELASEDKPLTQHFHYALAPILFQLAPIYAKKPLDEQAYYAYVIATFEFSHEPISLPLTTTLLNFLNSPSIHTRHNALHAICRLGSLELLLPALDLLDTSPFPYHPKLLTNGLLSFTGDIDNLNVALLKSLDHFSPHTQATIIDYLCLRNYNVANAFTPYLEKDSGDLQLRYAVIRYYTNLPCPDAYPYFIKFINILGNDYWTLRALSATALMHYPTPLSISTLIKYLADTNWFVRNNCAQSLIYFNLPISKLLAILKIPDTFAQDILSYHLERHPKYAILPEVIALKEEKLLSPMASAI